MYVFKSIQLLHIKCNSFDIAKNYENIPNRMNFYPYVGCQIKDLFKILLRLTNNIDKCLEYKSQVTLVQHSVFPTLD